MSASNIKSLKTKINTLKHQIGATKRLIAAGCKQFILQLIDLETELAIAQVNLESALAKMANTLITLEIDRGHTETAAYLTDVYNRDRHSRRVITGTKVSETKVTISLVGLRDGYYKVRDYKSLEYKYRNSWILVKDEQHIKSFEYESDIDDFEKVRGIKDMVRYTTLRDLNNLRELKGTPKQVAWANDIRKKMIANYIRQGGEASIPMQLFREDSAKEFINSWTGNRKTRSYGDRMNDWIIY